MQNRLPGLDLLRTVACLGVFGHHLPERFRYGLGAVWCNGGWVGVDLFFVLSGFLVSGLLFREHKKRGTLSVGRFLTRRALKLYPAFYFFLAVSVAETYMRDAFWPAATLSEAAFITNYYPPHIWSHTWSLAVEEHFYLALPILFWCLYRANRVDPFRYLPAIFIALAITCLTLRSMNTELVTTRPGAISGMTHFRMDSLFCGVTLGWAVYRYPHFLKHVRPWRWVLFFAGCACLSPAFFDGVSKSDYMVTAGFTVNYLGSGMIVLWGLTAGEYGPLGNLLAAIGAYSYSIYLWHLAVLDWFLKPYVEPVIESDGLFVAFYVALCLGVGVLMSVVVEWPVLRLRDRLFPSRS